jgi:hypothetical protein
MADVEVVFVNDLEASGFLNGIVNMAFSTYHFIPQYVPSPVGEEGKVEIVPAAKITANIRFDLRLAKIMRDRLDEIIEANTKPAPRASN